VSDQHEAAPTRRPLWMRLLQSFTGPWTRRNLLGWLAVFGLFLFLKGCVIDQFTVPTGSMEPTIHGDPNFFRGDRVLVNKWLYGLRIPFTTRWLCHWGAPKRWDIVVFRHPDPTSPHRHLIKRVVALPGERVVLHHGRVTIDGEELPLPPELPPDTYYVNNVDMQAMIVRWEDSIEQRAFLSMVQSEYPMRYGVEPAPGVAPADEYCVVPDNCYYVLGDNSVSAGQFSVDSRVWGWVPRENLLGRAFSVWWPWERRRDFTGFSKTWWGAALLYGIPGCIVLYEVVQRWRRRRSRQRAE